MSYSFEFEIENPKLISVNEQYMHPVRKTKNGRYVSYFAPSPYLKEVQKFYKDVLSEKIPDEDIEKLKETISTKDDGVELTIIVGLPRSDILEYDASNFIKALEDCIVSRTKIDDSRHFKVSIEKRNYESEDNRWIVKVVMSSMKILNY